jgi:hypothetical protein
MMYFNPKNGRKFDAGSNNIMPIENSEHVRAGGRAKFTSELFAFLVLLRGLKERLGPSQGTTVSENISIVFIVPFSTQQDYCHSSRTARSESGQSEDSNF